MENSQNEIVLQILGYLNLGELIQCARVSKRLKMICKDKSLTRNRPLIQLWCPRSKLNMDDFSVLACP